MTNQCNIFWDDLTILVKKAVDQKRTDLQTEIDVLEQNMLSCEDIRELDQMIREREDLRGKLKSLLVTYNGAQFGGSMKNLIDLFGEVPVEYRRPNDVYRIARD